jgi:hypothetical protein
MYASINIQMIDKTKSYIKYIMFDKLLLYLENLVQNEQGFGHDLILPLH